MKNDFLYTLSRKLSFAVPFGEMQDILQDYMDFSAQKDYKEEADAVLSALQLPKRRSRRSCLFWCIYVGLHLFALLLIFRKTSFFQGMSFSHGIFCILGICISFLVFPFLLWHKKAVLMGKFYENTKKEKIFLFLLHLLCFGFVVFFVNPNVIYGSIAIVQWVKRIGVVFAMMMSMLTYYCFLTKGISWYIPMQHSFFTLGFLVALQQELTRMDIVDISSEISYRTFSIMAFTVYLCFLALSFMLYGMGKKGEWLWIRK